ncbi:MAG: hypothetical protein WC935_00065 [Thermoleophilia bacterium]
MPEMSEFEKWWLSPEVDQDANKFDSRKGFEAGYARGLAAQQEADRACQCGHPPSLHHPTEKLCMFSGCRCKGPAA